MVDSVSRFDGFAEEYDRVRPRPPAALFELLRQYTGREAPAVVDLGAGTGLSTEPWQGIAGQLSAVEPNAEMAAIARARVPGLSIADGTAEHTGLPDACADLVTASQALHWFDAERALPEVARILRPGGVFAAYDCDWPPAVHPEVDAAYLEFERKHHAAQIELNLLPRKANKHEHAERMRDSGRFRLVREIALHAQDSGDAARLCAVAESQGGTVALRRAGVGDEGIGMDVLAATARRHLAEPRTWWWTYRIRIGVV
ncbi:class I SAM-dependent methyltransferase [Sciscionella marina]|uniref:class I SAM-dependent methyltransferase n=1 Tax=Sciscionella marina TaxID=508770 RepID=UPI00036233DF|nr:class I SAM-dependent methyltransferase [Sciscionella marina]